MTTNTDLGLTTGLQKIVDGFQALPSDQMRYKQILFMASKAPELEKERWTAESKVQGCLSTVHVHASKRDGKIFYEGDSDGLLTKGLVTILVKGLSGNTPGDIQKVKPEFIKTVGGVSLTPGRNNGFMNMLAMMKRLASSLADDEDGGGAADADGGRPIYAAMMKKLGALQPAALEVVDNSAGHAGHKEAQDIKSDESHFEVKIVANAFEGLSLVKRHQLVYMVLAEEMKTIHAIQINAKTPSEVAKS
eukprot:CAMPEP_0194598556 /NCGR_PEP_ID=MMETSP0292-20121207/27078_1 /TAXON_ID=39354 /ORGANISM="Heterosigma akashiwo, Strain CCMP2393" /LENGTH=247 /DNA_ID=CAMNT_0039459537 /DNA_START=232 /DNA_END=973 /DNA_ORIENTATION=+